MRPDSTFSRPAAVDDAGRRRAPSTRSTPDPPPLAVAAAAHAPAAAPAYQRSRIAGADITPTCISPSRLDARAASRRAGTPRMKLWVPSIGSMYQRTAGRALLVAVLLADEAVVRVERRAMRSRMQALDRPVGLGDERAVGLARRSGRRGGTGAGRCRRPRRTSRARATSQAARSASVARRSAGAPGRPERRASATLTSASPRRVRQRGGRPPAVPLRARSVHLDAGHVASTRSPAHDAELLEEEVDLGGLARPGSRPWSAGPRAGA